MSIDRAKVVQNAQKHLARGQLDKAIAEYNKLVKDQPKDARILLKVGDIYTRKGDTAGACYTYHQVARLYADQGFFLKAVAVYKQILKLDANQIEALRRLGEMYEALSLVSDALSTYELLSTALERAGKREQAIEIMSQMVRLDPKNVAACIRYAEALSKEGRNEEAAEAFEEGNRLLLEQGRIEDYLKVGERLLFLRPGDSNLAREMATRYLEHGDAKHALAKLQICFRTNPRDLEVLTLLGETFRKLGQNAKATSVYRQISRLHADAGRQSQQKIALEQILQLVPNDAEAAEELQDIKSGAPPRPSLSPTDADDCAWEQAAALRIVPELVEGGGSVRGSMPDGVSTALRRAVAGGSGVESVGLIPAGPPAAPLSGPSSDALLKRLLGECEVFVRYGLKDKAISQLNRLLDIDPQNLEARQRLKDLYVENSEVTEALVHLLMLAELTKKGKPKDAVGYLREVLQLDPHNEPAREQLQLLESSVGEAGAESWLAAAESEDDDEEIIFVDEGDADEDEPEEPEAEVITEEVAEDEAAELLEAEAQARAEREELPAEVEDALEEVRFYLSQGILTEARDALQDALESNPDHPALLDMLTEIEGLQHADASQAAPAPSPPAPPPSSPTLPSAVSRHPTPAVESASSDSHYDLGLAYMEMELLDKSINEFKLCLANPGQRRASHTMIGLCNIRKGEISEAIAHFKEGLVSPKQRDAEDTELLFELGNAYQLLGKRQEANEYFRQVADKDPGFRDVRQRLEKLSRTGAPKDDIEEFDVLFDDLIVKE